MNLDSGKTLLRCLTSQPAFFLIPTRPIRSQHKEIPHYHLSLYGITPDLFKPIFSTRCDSLGGCPLCLPGGNEVLGQVDADRCSCDGNMTVARPVQLTADLDLSSRHLPDLVDLGSLTADDRADQLQGSRGRTEESIKELIVVQIYWTAVMSPRIQY